MATQGQRKSSFVVSDDSATETSSEDEVNIRQAKPNEAVTQLLIQGLKHNNAKIPDSFEPFVDKSRIGALPLVSKPVVGYKSYKPLNSTAPPKGRTRRRLKKKNRKLSKKTVNAALKSGSNGDQKALLISDDRSDSIMIGSDDECSSTSGSFLSGDNDN